MASVQQGPPDVLVQVIVWAAASPAGRDGLAPNAKNTINSRSIIRAPYASLTCRKNPKRKTHTWEPRFRLPAAHGVPAGGRVAPEEVAGFVAFEVAKDFG